MRLPKNIILRRQNLQIKFWLFTEVKTHLLNPQIQGVFHNLYYIYFGFFPH